MRLIGCRHSHSKSQTVINHNGWDWLGVMQNVNTTKNSIRAARINICIVLSMQFSNYISCREIINTCLLTFVSIWIAYTQFIFLFSDFFHSKDRLFCLNSLHFVIHSINIDDLFITSALSTYLSYFVISDFIIISRHSSHTAERVWTSLPSKVRNYNKSWIISV